MKRWAFILLVFLLSSVPGLAATTVSGAGNHTSIPDNCGFEVPTGPGGAILTGWVRLKLWDDSETVDMRVASGPYPVRAKEIELFGGNVGPSSVVVNDSLPCTGTIYSHGYNIGNGVDHEECETDPSRPEVADADQVPPGPNLNPITAWVAGGQGDIDYLTEAQGDYGERWNIFRAHDGELMPAPNGVRRCRYVDVFWAVGLNEEIELRAVTNPWQP